MIKNILPINKNFCEIITNRNSFLKFKENYKTIIEEISLNRSSLDEIKDFLEITEESIFLDYVRYILLNKYKHTSKAIFQGINFYFNSS